MTMQDNVDIKRGRIRRKVLQPKFQTLTGKIDNQRPIRVPIAVTAHNSERRTDRLEIISDRWLANVAQVPDLVCVARKIDNRLRQLVMCVCQNKHSHLSTPIASNTLLLSL